MQEIAFPASFLNQLGVDFLMTASIAVRRRALGDEQLGWLGRAEGIGDPSKLAGAIGRMTPRDRCEANRDGDSRINRGSRATGYDTRPSPSKSAGTGTSPAIANADCVTPKSELRSMYQLFSDALNTETSDLPSPS